MAAADAPGNWHFEQGPIRPPNEAASLLLRITRNCPWNRCKFCAVYKRRKFSLRTVEEIKEDIRAVRAIVDDIRATSRSMGGGGNLTAAVASHIFQRNDLDERYNRVAAWLYYDTGACFLQDADNLILKTDDLVAILTYLRETLPEIRRVTTYSRSRTVVNKSAEALTRIREAGLDRVHIGMETGYDPLLKWIKKGVSAEQQVDAGLKVKAAGMELSEYVMPGLGGRAWWREHATETARTLNRIDPHFIRLRSLRIPKRAPLFADKKAGDFEMQPDDDLIREIRLFIETLEGIHSTIASDHFMNLLEDVSGKLPEEKEKILATIDGYLTLSDADRQIYRLGRRAGKFRSTRDLRRDSENYRYVSEWVREVKEKKGDEGVERLIGEMVDQYV